MTSLRIATRGSALARWQAERVAEGLRARHPGLETSLVEIQSHGDAHAEMAVAGLGVGVFTRAIEAALRDGRADVAVHSLKDLPTEETDGLEIAALLPRDDPRDVLVAGSLARAGVRDGEGAAALAALPRGACIGTSSLRRRAELLRARPDLVVEELRGNVPTRVERVERGEVDGIVLSRAGLVRLGLAPAGAVALDVETMLPAPAQGTIAAQVRSADAGVRELVAALDDGPTRICTACERLLLHALEGGCRVPLGALATLDGKALLLRARLLSPDGKRVLEGAETGPASDLGALAIALALGFRTRGAAEILAAARAAD